eukprot:1387101-Alexandrium_andersonii.AAC.1
MWQPRTLTEVVRSGQMKTCGAVFGLRVGLEVCASMMHHGGDQLWRNTLHVRAHPPAGPPRTSLFPTPHGS